MGRGHAARGDAPRRRLLSQTEIRDQLPISTCVLPAQVVQQPAAAADHLEQTPTGMVILPVRGEMVGKSGDPGGQHRDLHLGGSNIAFVTAMPPDDFLSNTWSQCQTLRPVSSRILRMPAGPAKGAPYHKGGSGQTTIGLHRESVASTTATKRGEPALCSTATRCPFAMADPESGMDIP